MLRDFIFSSMGRLGALSSEKFGTVPNSPDITVNTIALQNAIDFSSLYNVPIFIPQGVYLIDGYKGPFESWDATHGGGLWLKAGARLWGSGRGSTILRNAADNWRMVIGVKNGTGIELKHLTIDGDVFNHPNIPLGDPTSELVDDKRGEGIIFWGGDTAGIEFEIEDVEVMNTGHYGIGLQNVKILKGSILNTHYKKIGGDCIDSKAYATRPKSLMIRGFWTEDGCGHNYPGGPGVSPHTNQACIDVRGHCLLSDIFIKGLDSFGTSLGANGVRFSPPVNSEGRLGAAGSEATNLRIESTKLASEGSSTVKRIIGIAITDSDIEISNYKIKNCYWGIRVFDSGDGVPEGVNISNGSAIDCSSAAGNEALGLGVTSACSLVSVTNHRSINCEMGADLAGTLGSYFGLTLVDNTTIGLNASDAFFETNTISAFHFSNNADDMNAAVLETILRSSITKRGTAVVKDRGGTVSIVSTANDGSWSGANAVIGGFQVLTSDTGGAGVGLASQMLTEMRAASGATGSLIRFKVQGAASVVDTLTMSEDAVVAAKPMTFPAMPVASLPTTAPAGSNAFANDSNATLAAGLGNVVVGGGANFVPVYFDAGAQWRIG